jgi:hypothetical protein
VERNRKAGQNPPSVVAPIEEEEEEKKRRKREVSRNAGAARDLEC